jgi:hypothetical protein
MIWSLPVDPAAGDGAWGVPEPVVNAGSTIRITRMITIARALTMAIFFDGGIIFYNLLFGEVHDGNPGRNIAG